MTNGYLFKIEGKTFGEWLEYLEQNRDKFPITYYKHTDEEITDDLVLCNDTCVEYALDLGDKLNFFDDNGEWKSNEHRDLTYQLVQHLYEIEEPTIFEDFLQYCEEDNEQLANDIKTWLADFFDFPNRTIPVNKDETDWIKANLTTDKQKEIFGKQITQ